MTPENIVKEPITEYGQLDLNGEYTWVDYLKWKFAERVELIKGKIVKMSPAPNTFHQTILSNTHGDFFNFFKLKSCSVFLAPFDVRLPVPSGFKDSTVVQPDLCIICDHSKIAVQGCIGAPDLVVEILSPGNSRHDLHIKFDLYEESGVKEYWIIQPETRVVQVFSLQQNRYIGLRPFTEGMQVESLLFPELQVEVDDLFKGVITDQ
jgi:Uma2 family endonuclease